MYPSSHLRTRRIGTLLPKPHVAMRFSEEQLICVTLPERYLLARRFFELFLILGMLPVILPFTMLIALAIRIDSPGPIFFMQKRVGHGGRRFVMVKFRSMRAGAQRGSPLTQERDRRITRLGRFLRAYHLDELPQLWNVLKGDMSLIGPRPEVAVLAETFERRIPLYRYRRLVPSGMTGWAQVNQGYAADIESTRLRLGYDLHYVTNLSPGLDLRILCRTLYTVLTRYGSR